MSFVDNLKRTGFWKRVLFLGGIFFIMVVIISLLFNQFSNIISGDFAAVYENEWANGKWKSDLAFKAAISLVYAVYMVSRRQKLGKDISEEK